MSRSFSNALLLLLSLFLASCTATQVTRDAQQLGGALSFNIEEAGSDELAEMSDFTYKLSIGDELEVRYLQHLQLSTTVAVGPDGNIALPFLPMVMAEGLSVEEVTEEISRRYRELEDSLPDPATKNYYINVGDVLEVKFPFVSQYSGQVTVRPDGRISLPLVTSVVAEGKTPEALQTELTERYSEELQNPELVVNVLSSYSSSVFAAGQRTRVVLPDLDSVYVVLRSGVEPKVYVGGEVKSPQSIRFEPRLSSLQAIVAAGGTTLQSSLNRVIILRKSADGSPRYIVRNLAADLKGNSVDTGSDLVVTNDILLRPFDVIIVPRTRIARVSDALNAYLFDLLPMLRNSSVGFNYQIGTMEIEQDTNIIDP